MYSVAVLINSASKYRERPKVIFLAPLLITAVSIFFFIYTFVNLARLLRVMLLYHLLFIVNKDFYFYFTLSAFLSFNQF